MNKYILIGGKSIAVYISEKKKKGENIKQKT